MSNRFISLKYLFSYWVFLWFIVYFFASLFTEENKICYFIYENTNPLFLFILAILFSFRNLLLMLIYNSQWQIILKHIIKFTVIKGIPIIYLCYQKIKPLENIIFSLFALIIYFIYLFYKKENVFLIYKDHTESVLSDKPNTTLEYLIHEIQHKIKLYTH